MGKVYLKIRITIFQLADLFLLFLHFTLDVCLKTNVGIADSLYNLRVIRSFCERHLPHKTWHFTYEDLLYTHEKVKINIMMMISEIFYWFEIKTLPIVTGAGLSQKATGDEEGQGKNALQIVMFDLKLIISTG